MSCGCCILTKLIQLCIIYGYPGYKVIRTAQEKNLQKLWIIYFLIIGLFSILEGTILFPIIYILGKVSRRIYPMMKTLFHLWLYYPEYRGALFLDQKFGNFINLAFLKANPLAGKVISFLGIPDRDTDARTKKTE